jgi:hypothetical protein
VVAVVGSTDVMSAEELERLLALLVNRHTDTHSITLISAGRRSPKLQWCHGRGWGLLVEPEGGNAVKQDCALVAIADALVVLGDPKPWERLLWLCREARIPTRVFRERPWLPPPREYPPEE